MATEVEIQNLYIAYFNRPADKAGLAYWKDVSLSLLQIAQSFSEQKEYASAFAGFTAEQTINALYNNLFNHKADADGLAYWSGQIKSGKVSIGAAAIAILNGATGADQMAVQSKNVAAIAFTKKLATDAAAAYAYSMGGSVFNLAKSWLAPVIDNASGTDAVNNLGIAIEKLISNAPYGSDRLANAIIVPVIGGQNNTGKNADFSFSADDSQLLKPNTSLNGGNGNVALNVNTYFSPVSHTSSTITGVQTLNLQAGSDTSFAGTEFMNSFQYINANKLNGGDNIVLGNLAGQTVQLNNITGSSSVTLGGANQSVIQASEQGRAYIKTTNANLATATLNFINATAGEHILEITNSGAATLGTANMLGINSIILRGDESSLTLSPSRAITINMFGSNDNSLTVNNGQQVNITSVKASSLTLGGNSKFIIANSQFRDIRLTDKGGTLSIKDSNDVVHSITSNVATTVDVSNMTSMLKLGGAGSYTITGLGMRAGSYITNEAITGTVNVSMSGSYSSTYAAYTTLPDNGAITINLDGTGMLSLYSSANSSSTRVNVNVPGASITVLGSYGKVDIVEAEGKSGVFNFNTIGFTTTNLQLATTGGGDDLLNIKNAWSMSSKNILTTVSNFNVTGADKFITGLAATTLGNFTISTSDYDSLRKNIVDGAAAAKQRLSNTAGQAYIINIDNGEAAGTYLYQHKINLGDYVGYDDILVKLIGAAHIDVTDIISY
ncbi:hypothetical protein UNDYM_4021 [Undibacterium sp. YM2]|uniref:DUF4214 domain-containing protein n=1 Tax=Undibacterium sp. YM2 TaxID=2058625 RepID=UPI001331D321|nr:DUF4214 domain-containing protein [Undibacterium sp. YM2]BBB68274.1 hypothetical protein UNDYM_4021 [Undibacterium sp. YM2]